MPTIKFTAMDYFSYKVADRPYPAINAIPEWWKKLGPFTEGDKKPKLLFNGNNNGSTKRCMPMLDSITSGYVIPLWADVYVHSASDSEYQPLVSWRTTIDVFEQFPPVAYEVETPTGYSKYAFKFQNKWLIKTPPGYSTVVSQPAGYQNTNMMAIPGIVDTDKHEGAVPIPLWFKDGFEGVIEQGTPIAQITPFKRESWNSKFEYLENEEYLCIENKTIRKKVINYYTQHHWSKKVYK